MDLTAAASAANASSLPRKVPVCAPGAVKSVVVQDDGVLGSVWLSDDGELAEELRPRPDVLPAAPGGWSGTLD